jgi:hypothetical protein
VTIEITNPEVEVLINQRLQTGRYDDAEAVILEALRLPPASTIESDQPVQDIEQLFAPLRGLKIDFTRNPSTGRPIDL